MEAKHQLNWYSSGYGSGQQTEHWSGHRQYRAAVYISTFTWHATCYEVGRHGTDKFVGGFSSRSGAKEWAERTIEAMDTAFMVCVDCGKPSDRVPTRELPILRCSACWKVHVQPQEQPR
jgi:hypothetical protein